MSEISIPGASDHSGIVVSPKEKIIFFTGDPYTKCLNSSEKLVNECFNFFTRVFFFYN